MTKTICLVIVLSVLLNFGNFTTNYAQEDEEVKVLFIGNSYTGANSLPNKVKFLAESFGKVIITESLTPGGYTLMAHAQDQQTYDMINFDQWDFVVIQAQSQEPSFPPWQVSSQTYPYAEVLCDSIITANECSEPVFFMTWGRKNGDTINGQTYPVIATYEGMQLRLRQSYLEMAYNNDATCAPVGAAWQWVRNNYPSIELYESDESHPSIYGTYLAACVFFATFYAESPLGGSYFPSPISQTDATILQTAAQNIVIDSLDVWRINANLPDASYQYDINGATVNFTNASQGNNSVLFDWNFGDGNFSVDTNPVHTYSSTGTYTVTLIARTGCASDTSTAEVNISSMIGINKTVKEDIEIYPNPFKNQLSIKSENVDIQKIQLISVDGKLITTVNYKNEGLILNVEYLLAGIYFIHVIKNESVIRKKLIKI